MTFPCNWDSCNESFEKKSALKKHYKAHSNEYPFFCSVSDCGQRFKQKGHLTVHTRTHTGKKHHQPQTSSLTRHQRTHTDVKKFLDDEFAKDSRLGIDRSKSLAAQIGRDPPWVNQWFARKRYEVKNDPKPNSFICVFCKDEDIHTGFSRKDALKKHIVSSHHRDSHWICELPGCDMAFDTAKGYREHMMSVHDVRASGSKKTPIVFYPQTVFACGFRECLQVFEASVDAGVNKTLKLYVEHLMRHYNEDPRSGSWTFTTRMRNLLRQSSLKEASATCLWLTADPSNEEHFSWRNTAKVRKILETKHIENRDVLIDYTNELFGCPEGQFPQRRHLRFPIKDDCVISVVGHFNNAPLQFNAERRGTHEVAEPTQLPSPDRPLSTSSSSFGSELVSPTEGPNGHYFRYWDDAAGKQIIDAAMRNMKSSEVSCSMAKWLSDWGYQLNESGDDASLVASCGNFTFDPFPCQNPIPPISNLSMLPVEEHDMQKRQVRHKLPTARPSVPSAATAPATTKTMAKRARSESSDDEIESEDHDEFELDEGCEDRSKSKRPRVERPLRRLPELLNTSIC